MSTITSYFLSAITLLKSFTPDFNRSTSFVNPQRFTASANSGFVAKSI